MSYTDFPKEPTILLSFLNTQLRDNFSSLPELCKEYGVDINDIIGRMKKIDYSYDETSNQFR